MRKTVASLLGVAVLGALFLTPAQAAVKAGSLCPKANKTMIAAGTKLTCVKFGKKLIWAKGKRLMMPSMVSLEYLGTMPFRFWQRAFIKTCTARG